MGVCVVFFVFKQKTAYEMRISDWSSDVCSSDLALCLVSIAARERAKSNLPLLPPWVPGRRGDCIRWHLRQIAEALPPLPLRPGDQPCRSRPDRHRSEEHTSELQSLMRISYAVFCLKKKKNNTLLTTKHTTI